MSDGKYDRVRQVDFVGVLVDGSRDNRWVDDDRVIGGHGFATQLHAGILRRKVDADVFVQDERYPDLTCKRTVGGGGTVQSSTSDTWVKKMPRCQEHVDTPTRRDCSDSSQRCWPLRMSKMTFKH